MTRVEMREVRKKQIRSRIVALVVLLLISFMLGMFTHWCFCKFNHEDVQKVEHSGSVTVYVIPKTDTTEESTSNVEEPEQEEEFVSYYTYTIANIHITRYSKPSNQTPQLDKLNSSFSLTTNS